MKTVLLCVLLGLASANEERIFRPIKEGQEVGLVIIPGSSLNPEQYYVLVGNIQEASEFALWVYVEDTPTSVFPPRTDFVVKSKAALKEAGLPEGVPFISTGHSMGGAMMMIELTRTPSLVDGIVTWGADGFITRNNYENFPYPGMTMAGDLDGMTRFTDMATQFRSLSVLPLQDRLIYPVRTLEGLNHTSYNTGPVPPSPQLRDLPSEIDGEEARRMIAADHAFFVDFCARIALGEDTSSDWVKLQEWLDFQEEVYAPVINAMELEQLDSVSPWISQAQRIIGDAFEDEINVENQVLNRIDFYGSRPSIEQINEDSILAATTVSKRSKIFWTSAQTLETKMNSREMFDEVLDREPGSDPGPTCRDVNKAAWDLIYPTISVLARRRYEAKGYTVNFNEDLQLDASQWVNSEMQWTSDGQTLDIGSTSFRTNVSDPDLPGVHYCKLVSPFRLLEFLYIDSQRINGF